MATTGIVIDGEEVPRLSSVSESFISKAVQDMNTVADGDRARKVASLAKTPFAVLDDGVDFSDDSLAIGTMHHVTGLEFRAVAVMACDNEVIPLQERMEFIGEGGDLQEVYDSERQLLYVACTRTRDHLLVTSVEPASEFLEDLLATN